MKAVWEGSVHKATLTGSAKGRQSTWRYMDSGLMVVRTAIHLDKAHETSMFWYLEAIDEPEHQPVTSQGMPAIRQGSRSLLYCNCWLHSDTFCCSLVAFASFDRHAGAMPILCQFMSLPYR